jgi:D-sedoheptulose 7-phosphate isomerase
MLEQRIQQQFFDSADLKYAAAEVLTRPITDASHALLGCITAGGKVLACGNGGSAADAQRFASAFLGGFERERPALQAMCLSGDAAAIAGLGQQGVFEQVFAKQVQALGHPGDLLLVLSTDGAAANILAAVDAAHEKDMTVVALVGKEGGAIAARLNETDVLISVPHSRAARIQEVHLLVLHCLCDAVDVQLLGEHDE